MSVTIRRARIDDAAAICDVHRAAVRGICRESYSAQQIEIWSELLTPDRYSEPLRNQVIFVAEEEQKIVGFSQMDPGEEVVLAVYVAPSAVRKGIGGALLSRLEAEAIDRGIRKLALDATLNAEPFYEQLGYRAARMNQHSVAPEVSLACIHMEKTLD